MLRVCQPPAMRFFMMFILFWIHGNGFYQNQWPSMKPILLVYLKKNIEALKHVFLHFEDILVKTFPDINVLSVEEEFILVVSHAIKHFNTQIHPLLALWQYLYGICESKSWLNIFGVIEVRMCAPCSNATLETFFSQLCVVTQSLK